jgi:antitoxin HicB
MKRGDLKLDRYRFTVRPVTAEEGTGCLIEFPDVPLCLSDGATVEEAIASGRDALIGLRVPRTVHARLTNRARPEDVSLNTLVTAMIAEGLGKRKASWHTANPRVSRRLPDLPGALLLSRLPGRRGPKSRGRARAPAPQKAGRPSTTRPQIANLDSAGIKPAWSSE